MKAVSLDNIERFLGGMFAYIGLQALASTVYLLTGFTHTDLTTIAVTAFPCLGLVIGIAMLLGRRAAVSWAIAFLAARLLLGLWGVIVATTVPPSNVPEGVHLVMASVVNLPVPFFLLCVLVWCRSRQLRNEAIA